MITIKTNFGNPNCLKKESVWQSQTKIEGTKAAAGNILLSFAILLAGALASKVLRVFAHMGLSCHSLRQFYRHQKVSSKNNHFVYFILGRFPQESRQHHMPIIASQYHLTHPVNSCYGRKLNYPESRPLSSLLLSQYPVFNL